MPQSTLPPSVVSRANQLALKMLKAVEPDRLNLVLAPITTQLALQMTAAGARGETANELVRTLGLKPDQGLLVASEVTQLAARSNQGQSLQIASGLYVDSSLSLASAFEKTVREGFHASLKQLPFAVDADAARLEINRDVARLTADKLQSLLPPGSVEPLTRTVLVSAVRADLAWQEAFDAHATRDEPFKRADGSEKAVPFMQREATFSMGMLGEDTTVIEIPYAGGELAMVVVLPPPQHASKSVYDADVLGRTLERLAPAKILLKLPRFSIKLESTSLKPVLEALGLKRLFSSNADLSAIAGKPGDLFVADVVHGAYVEVSERGTEASGASAVTIRTRSAQLRPPPTVAVDRPFVFLIRQVSSGLILFAGRVGSP